MNINLINTLKKIINITICIAKTLLVKENDLKEFEILKNKYHGKRCFIVGNGPSLKKLDLSKLNNEYLFISNLIYKKDYFVNPKKAFYGIEDKVVYEDNKDEIDSLVKYRYKFLPSDISYSKKGFLVTKFIRTPGIKEKSKKFINMESGVLYWGGTVNFYLLQLAVWMGFSDIYFIGTDLNYVVPNDVQVSNGSLITTSSDPNHFFNDYFGKGKKWNIPHAERMKMYLTFGAEMAEIHGAKVYNASVGGNFDSIDRINFNEIF